MGGSLFLSCSLRAVRGEQRARSLGRFILGRARARAGGNAPPTPPLLDPRDKEFERVL